MNIKKIAFGTAASVLVMSATALPAFAAPSVHTNFGNQVNASACDTSGKTLVDVNYKIINDYDSGVAGNAWANDSINRRLQIWDQGNGNYCATVRDAGQFVTFAGLSPIDTGTVGAGIKGTMEGGYVATFTASSFDPSKPTNGTLGTMDYACTDAYTCPGAFDWWDAYFSDASYPDLTYWAWNYHAGNNGSMVQQSTTPNYQGDITGN